MRFIPLLLALLLPFGPAQAGVIVGYAITITTAYAATDPFPNRLDTAFTEPDTGYVNIANTGDTTFTGEIGLSAVSAFAGDLSVRVPGVILPPGASVSLAVGDDASNVGGFGGPAFTFRPGIGIVLNGLFTSGTRQEEAILFVSDAYIHSGVPRIDPFGLTSDSFVLQGGDPWGFDTGDAFELSQARGTFTFLEVAAEPLPLLCIGPMMILLHLLNRRGQSGPPAA